MKVKLFILFSAVTLLSLSCSKKTMQTNSSESFEEDPAGTAGNSITADGHYTITETMENGEKTTYATANVSLNTGSWTFNDALIGNSDSDRKNGSNSVRLRGGSVTSNFQISGVQKIYVKHARYGKDAPSFWQLMVSVNGAPFTQLGDDIAAISNSLVLDSFVVNATGKIRLRIQKTGTSRINLDDIVFRGAGNPGITVSVADTMLTDSSGSSEAALPRDILAGPDAPPNAGDDSNMLLGNPSNAQPNIILADNYLIDHKYFVEAYSSSRGTPNWVSWHLDATNITGAVKRQDNFAALASLPGNWFQVQSNSYSGSGFDRGHNCPSGDRTSSLEANSSTFLMTNMIPQAPRNNQGTWEKFETYIRSLVASGNEAYIIMGSYGAGGTGTYGTVNTIANGKITVPSRVWKIALILPSGTNDLERINSSTRVIAINTPNENSVNEDWRLYLVTVKDLESLTGHSFFSSLSADLQRALKTRKDDGN